MSVKVIKFPSIEQFRNIVANVNRQATFVGLDETGEAIYDMTRPKPTLTFKGTIKLHGTNFGVNYNKVDGIWAQSKESIITPESDNAGSAFFMETNKEVFQKLFNEVVDKYNIDDVNNTITIYGEWTGKGIQKTVAIANIEKSMFIIGVKITPHSNGENNKIPSYWVDFSFLRSPENRIYNIEDYKTYSIDIDFNNPQSVQNKIIEYTLEVEDECPVAKAFGHIGIGEGIVFTNRNINGVSLSFKSKGAKHSNTKVKKLKVVDDEKMNKVINLVNQVCTSARLEQALTSACNLMNGGMIDRKQLGNFIKLVISDVIKEESDIIAEAGLEPKDLNGKISEVARQFFFDQEKL